MTTEIDKEVDRMIGFKKPVQAGKFGMTIKYERPPIWEGVMQQFQINTDATIFTYGDVIYNPAEFHIEDEYIWHESIHAAQQGHSEEGAANWWVRYFQDQYFRIDQEAKAYAAQYDFWCKTNKDRNWRNKKLIQHSHTLASGMYGSVVSPGGAMRLIKQFSKTK